jgi:phosphate transport system permease protein
MMVNAESPGARLRWAYRKSTNVVMLGLCMLGAFVAVFVLGLVLYFLLSRGLSSLSFNFFTKLPNHVDERAGGMVQSIFGTLVLLGLASLIGLPLGILGGIYQVEARGRFVAVVRFLTDVLNGIPSIVIGIFVYAVAVLPVAEMNPGSGFSAYAGGLALGIMMIPTVMRTTEEILRLVPMSMREASLALGATRWRTMGSVVLPAAKGGIITGVMLALARIAGETAPLLFTILGNEFFDTHKVKLLGAHVTVPTLTAPIDALPWRIYYYATQPDQDLNNQAWAGAVVLILMILVFSVAARAATRTKFMEEK